MPTNFIAVQCFHCSTMQVKQQKKSSNKWTCVVCNQKQSIRNVFAQSLMARDVRKYVQNFNMSCMLTENKQLQEEEEEEVEAFDSPDGHKIIKKRSDWSEYVDQDEEEYHGKFDEKLGKDCNSSFEAIVVTEMPKEMLFKKPKLKGSYLFPDKKLLKPTFPKKIGIKMQLPNDLSEGAEFTEPEQQNCARASAFNNNEDTNELPLHHRASKWSRFKAQIQETEHMDPQEPTGLFKRSISRSSDQVTVQDNKDHNNAQPIKPSGFRKAAKGPEISKWSSYISDEDDDKFQSRRTIGPSWEVVDDMRNKDALETLTFDEKVEDDIHPDFM